MPGHLPPQARILIQIKVKPARAAKNQDSLCGGWPLEITSLIITLLLVAVMLYLIVRLPLAILGNLRSGQRFREGLASTLGDLRLARMLKFLGIDQASYLHKEQALEIQQQMERCDGCGAKEQCDQVLGSDQTADVESLGFCANIEDLKEIRDDLRSPTDTPR